jgi:HK97 family phage portal protein
LKEAFLQRFVNNFIWNSRTEQRADTVNLENPNVPLDGFTLSQVLSGNRPSTSGVLVSPEAALKLSAVWRCLNILSGVISSFPCRPYYEDEKGARVIAKDHATYKLFHKRPNPLYTKTVYWERAVLHLLLRGNHYSEIVYAKNGVDIQQFNLIPPTAIKEIRLFNDKLWYYIINRDEPVPMDRMIHVPHLGEDLFSGKSVITYAREDLGMEIARRDVGGKFWQDGGGLQQMIIPNQRVTAQQEAQLKSSLREKKREGGTIIAPYGVTVQNVGLSPADQDFIMSGNFSIAAICRWFGVPLHKLSELDKATLNNVEQLAIEFLQDTISPIIEKIENEYETKCFTLKSEQDMELEFDMNSYLRADSVSRAEANRTAIQNGYMSPNEAAIQNGLPPIEGGDRRFIQQNMMPLDLVDKVLAKQPTPPTKAGRLLDNVRGLLADAELEYKLNGNGKTNHKA